MVTLKMKMCHLPHSPAKAFHNFQICCDISQVVIYTPIGGGTPPIDVNTHTHTQTVPSG